MVRSKARLSITTQQLALLGDQTDVALRSIFDKFDTSGDQALDADELKVALRAALGLDLTVDDCRRLVAMADRDGDGNVDFDEFCDICKQRL